MPSGTTKGTKQSQRYKINSACGANPRNNSVGADSSLRDASMNRQSDSPPFSSLRGLYNPKQSTFTLKPHILDCFALATQGLAKTIRGDYFGVFVIRLAKTIQRTIPVIARIYAVNSWQSTQKIKHARSAKLCKSFCFVLLSQKVESHYTLDSNSQKTEFLDCHAEPLARLAMTKICVFVIHLAKTIRRGFANLTQFARFATSYIILKDSQCKLKR